MNLFLKNAKKPGRWKNPDFYISLSFFFYILFFLMFFFASHVIAFLHIGQRVAQALTIIFLIAGALFSGIGNWFSLGYKVYPGHMEKLTAEELNELEELLNERRRELQEAKLKETEK